MPLNFARAIIYFVAANNRPFFCDELKKTTMSSFHISFLNLPVAKDDSFIGLPQAELIHANVDSNTDGELRNYVVEPLSANWKQQLGTIELTRTADEHWKLVRGRELVEGVFPRIIQAIEDGERTLDDAH
jgi:hypothetical protein